MLVGFASSSLSCCSIVLPLCWLLKTEPPISKWPLPRTANVPATARMKVWNKSSRSTLWVMACLEPGKGSLRSDFSSMDFPLRTIKYKCTSSFPWKPRDRNHWKLGKYSKKISLYASPVLALSLGTCHWLLSRATHQAMVTPGLIQCGCSSLPEARKSN